MNDTSSAAAAAPRAGWLDLVREGRGVYSALICLGVSLHAMDVFIIATVMPSVVSEIGGVAFYTWSAMLYVITSIIGAACGGYTRAALGSRRGYALGGLIFMVGTIGCAVSPSMAALLVARAIQGFGGGLTMAQSMALISELYAGTLRQRIMAANNIVWTVTALAGPTIGGVFADIGFWRGAFWVTVPISVWMVVVAWRRLPVSGRAPNLPRLPLERLGLLALAVVAVAAAGQLNERALQLALIAVAVALMWFTFHRDNTSSSHLFPHGALDVRTQTGLAYWVVICVSISYATISLFMPLVLQRVHNVTPLFAGSFNMLLSVMWSVGAVAVAGMTGWRQRAAMVVGAAFMAIGAAGMAIGTAEAPTWVVAVFASFVGLGIGANNVILFNWVMSHASKGEETLTASSLPAIRSIGVAFGSALSGVIANSAGLTETADAASVARAVDWVYGLDVIPALLATALTVRLVTASHARAHDSATR